MKHLAFIGLVLALLVGVGSYVYETSEPVTHNVEFTRLNAYALPIHFDITVHFDLNDIDTSFIQFSNEYHYGRENGFWRRIYRVELERVSLNTRIGIAASMLPDSMGTGSMFDAVKAHDLVKYEVVRYAEGFNKTFNSNYGNFSPPVDSIVVVYTFPELMDSQVQLLEEVPIDGKFTIDLVDSI